MNERYSINANQVVFSQALPVLAKGRIVFCLFQCEMIGWASLYSALVSGLLFFGHAAFGAKTHTQKNAKYQQSQ
ncbi:hypothetical protein C7N83_10905 [Neisseria iguanae]|uniref:Uncharacterized protein n=1 Tax=Neisseria iguanae TaxID=90242 RepID=A0A2P7TY50_9NEIS|nr:hypothetical protein C7N83_10905 [Neisseria iguanae]